MVTEQELQQMKEEAQEKKNILEKPKILLPSQGRLISEFAKEVSEVLKDKYTLFFRPASRDIIEITKIKERDKSEEYIGFSAIRPERLITQIEKYITPSIEVPTKYGTWIAPKSMNAGTANILLNSAILQNALPKIKRIFPSPIPIIYDGKLTFPKKGYDERFYSYTPLDAPEIRTDMKLEDAKIILHNIYSEFCFQDKQDYINAISSLLTPFCRGLFTSYSSRTPLVVFSANRERAGKEYCANITGIVHEGYAIEEPPISTGEANGNNNEELRKKLTSSMMGGRKRLHFSNNKGIINNAVLEGVLTSEKYSDRALGRNEILNFDNEIDYSLSGNVGIGLTADLSNRSIFVRLFLDIEDANSRKFNNPNLHKWIKDNRSLILSSLYALVNNWYDKGCIDGSIPFASFPEWARVCDGIMECAGYGSPCLRDKTSLSIGVDIETCDMKSLFELCYEKFPDVWINKQQIKKLVLDTEDSLFGYLDFNKKADQTKFGLKITKFVGRVLSDIVLKVNDEKVRASRQEFMFTKEKVENDKSKIFGNLGNLIDNNNIKELGNLGNFGNLFLPSCIAEKINNEGSESLQSLPSLPNKNEGTIGTPEKIDRIQNELLKQMENSQ